LMKALSSVADHTRAHMNLGLVQIVTRRAAEGIAECEHALALNRNLAHAHSNIGFGKIFIGRAEDAEAHITEALRLSPRDTWAYIWMNVAGHAMLQLGSWDQAVAWFRRSKEANPNYQASYFNSAAALAQLGRFDEAKSAVQGGLRLNPAYAVSRVRATWTARSDNPTYLAQLEPIFDGMRKAGVPEQ
jgi:tetratricopeptide (TPR) repeat protein